MPASTGPLGTAIALFEYSSIAAGIEAGDDMVKRAPLQIIHAGTVHPGKYLVLVGGEVADVEEAIVAAHARDVGPLIDHMFLPDPEPRLVEALSGAIAPATGEALGIVETASIADVIRAADAGLKGADVALRQIFIADDLGGRGYLLFSGTLSEVQAAVDLATERVAGDLIGTRVLPRIHAEMDANLEGDGRFASRLRGE